MCVPHAMCVNLQSPMAAALLFPFPFTPYTWCTLPMVYKMCAKNTNQFTSC